VLVHGRARGLPRRPDGITAWHLTRWRAGLAHPRRLGAPSLEALLSGGVEVVRREASAASEQALRRAARSLGVRVPRGPRAAGHLEAAQRAAWTGGAAVTIEPAARAYGLAFHELETHEVELWVAGSSRGHPGVDALVEVLNSTAFRLRVLRLDGYDLEGCGSLAA